MRIKAGLLALFAALFSAESARAGGPVLIELFTSQGCSSCPPADAYLGELAKRRDVVVLAFHIDYWDYIGWKDPFGDAAWTARQRQYAQSLKTPQIYTPQMVVDGGNHAVGSDRRAVERLIAEAAKRERPTLELKRTAEGLSLAIQGQGEGEVWIVGYDPRHETKVVRGENAGRTLTEVNVVRGIRQIEAWKGGSLTRSLALGELPPGAAYVAVVQAPNLGRVLATAATP
ncbi:MAG: DUF1223 domain-containing protein [Alphaproteobacteria bacterium]|nr:DUF1223 domain-containing protein [Alphaproteobacteria bacterium]